MFMCIYRYIIKDCLIYFIEDYRYNLYVWIVYIMGILLKIFLIIFLFNKIGFFEFYCCIMVFIFRINVRFYSIVMWGIVVIFIGNYRINFFYSYFKFFVYVFWCEGFCFIYFGRRFFV